MSMILWDLEIRVHNVRIKYEIQDFNSWVSRRVYSGHHRWFIPVKGNYILSTKLYFAVANSFHINRDTFGRWDWSEYPLNILCAFRPLEGYQSWCNRNYGFVKGRIIDESCHNPAIQFERDYRTILDSGAFSAWKSGTQIDIDELIAAARSHERGYEWDEVAALDVIGDPLASYNNAKKMQDAGLPVIPVFHYGEDWEYLTLYKERFGDRIGLGGIATGLSSKDKRRWLAQCFARAYPAKFHGFGVASEDILMEFPFYSVDTASWHTAARFGRSAAVPDIVQPKKSALDGTEFDGSGYDFRYEIRHYLDLQTKVQERWKEELAWTKN